MKPIVGITMGDAAGIGPEGIAKALAHKELYDVCTPLVVGDASVMKNALKIVKKEDLKVQSLDDPAKAQYQYGTIHVLDLHNIDASKLQPILQLGHGKKLTEEQRRKLLHAQLGSGQPKFPGDPSRNILLNSQTVRHMKVKPSTRLPSSSQAAQIQPRSGTMKHGCKG